MTQRRPISHPGIDPGTWNYIQEPGIAEQYDDQLKSDRLAQADQAILEQLIQNWPAELRRTAADFGCGTGRTTLQLAQAGFDVIAIDLSAAMLQKLRKKLDRLAPRERNRVGIVQANLLDLNCLTTASLGLAVCLYSTLGMLRGRANRKSFLERVRESLADSGQLVIHAHNLFWQLNFPGGFTFLVRNWIQACWSRRVEFGDRFADQIVIRQLPIHSFTRRTIQTELRAAGFQVQSVFPIRDWGDRRSWLCRWLAIRDQGWILICKKTR